MIARLSIVIWLSLLGLFTTLFVWAGLGFDHQVVTNWVTTVNNSARQVMVARSHYRHGHEGLVALCVLLGFVWTVLALAVSLIVREAWNGYKDW